MDKMSRGVAVNSRYPSTLYDSGTVPEHIAHSHNVCHGQCCESIRGMFSENLKNKKHAIHRVKKKCFFRVGKLTPSMSLLLALREKYKTHLPKAYELKLAF